MATAANYDLNIEQGATHSQTLLVKDGGNIWDLTDYTAVMTFFDRSTGTEILELASEDGEIVITGNEGKIVFTVTSTQTALLTKSCGYKLKITDDSVTPVVTVLLKGEVKLKLEYEL